MFDGGLNNAGRVLAEVVAQLPAWARWGRRQGLMLEPIARELGADRLPRYCRWCRTTDLPKRRASWCSDEHVQLYISVGSWPALKALIRARDRDICRSCGTDRPGWRPVRHHTFGQSESRWLAGRMIHTEACDLYPFWEIDHELPIALGGTDDPDNLRLLCGACHRLETSRLATMLAKAKRRAEGMPGAVRPAKRAKLWHL